MDEKEWVRQQPHSPQKIYRDKFYTYTEPDNRHHRKHPKNCSDSGVYSDNNNSQKQSKQTSLAHSVEGTYRKKSERHVFVKTREELRGIIKTRESDPNDLQNFSKKSLTKETTNELIQAATENIKQCNIEQERKLINMKARADESKFDCPWVRETSKGFSEFKNSSRGDSIVLSSNASTSSSNCCESCFDNISLCGSENDCCECPGPQFSTSPVSCLVKNCCNAVGGVFWNNEYNEHSTDKPANCCCSMSSCDEDDCSYFEGSLGDNLKIVPVQLKGSISDELKQNKKFMQKVGTVTGSSL